MREIKFRAWLNAIEEFAEILEMVFEDKKLIGIVTDKERKNEADYDGLPISTAYWENFNLMQYTGLKDKNGKEIYEGDIVKWGHIEGWSEETPVRIAEVKFNPDIEFDSQVGIFKFGQFAYQDTQKYLEIIGNIYEHPELLEVKND